MAQLSDARLSGAGLVLGYFLVFSSMLVYLSGLFGSYTIEWAALPFLAAAAIFFFSRVDSRFLILPAILLLSYCPFLLVYGLEALAEDIAIFVYYFLVFGVLLQFLELRLSRGIVADFSVLGRLVDSREMLYLSVFFFLMFNIAFFFFPFRMLMKASFLWLGSASFIIFLLSRYVIDNDLKDKKRS